MRHEPEYEKTRYLVESGPTKLARIISIDGLTDERMVVRFTRDLMWFRRASATARIGSPDGGFVRTDCGTRNDFYGLFSGAEEVIEIAKACAEEYDFGPQSKLAALAIFTVYDVPRIDLLPGMRDGYGPDKLDFTAPSVKVLPAPSDWFLDSVHIDDLAAETRLENRFGHPAGEFRLRERPVFSGTIWSSKNTEDENARLLEAARAVVEIRRQPETA